MTTTTFRQAGFIFLPLLLFFMSCTVEESEREITDMRIPVVFNAPAVTLQTRTSVDGDRWIGGDRVGIYMLSAGGSLPADIVGDAGNRQYTVSSVNAVNAASLAPVNSNTDMIMYPPTGNVDFVACYPYQAAGADGNGYYPVNVSNQNNPAAIDLMYARVTNVGKSSATVSLPFEHVMSRLVLNIRKGTGLVDSDFADITATMSGMPVKAGFSLSDRQFVPEGNLAFPMRKATAASGSIATFDAVVIPGTGGTRRVTFRLNGNEYNWTVPAADIFQPGKRYTYAITLKVS